MTLLQQGAMTPQLAEAAAQAGAAPAGAAPAGAAPAGAAPAGPPGAAPAGAAPAGPPGAAPAGPPGAAPAGPPGAAPGGAAASMPDAAIAPYMQQGTPEEQQEYERAMRALAKVLYSNDTTANAIVDQITPNDLVSSTAKVGMLFIKELDRKINMDESVVASVTQETVERVAELAEARHGVEYKASDMEKILGATWEGVQTMFGNEDTEGYAQTVRSMAPEHLQALQTQHDSILAQGK